MRLNIGVIGGMGNEAMVDLAGNMADRSASDDVQCVLYGNSRQAFTPVEADGEWEEGDPPLQRKRETGKFTAALIHTLGAEVAGLSCNDQHPLFREIYADMDADFVDMIDETAMAINDHGALVLGTKRTLQERLYDKQLEQRGVSAYQPTPENRERLMQAIYDPEYGIKTGEITDRAREDICDIVTAETERHGVESVVLGCTELPLLFSDERTPELQSAGAVPEELHFVDPTDILAAALLQAEGPTRSLSSPDPTEFFGEFCDYHPPFTCVAESLERVAEIQSNIINRTEEYFKRQGDSVVGSYMHVPTLFLVNHDRPNSMPAALDITVHDPMASGFDDEMQEAIAENYESVSEYL